MRFFLCVIGMVMIVEGLPYFAFPEKIKPWLLKLVDTPSATLRQLGFIMMLIGMGLVFVGSRFVR